MNVLRRHVRPAICRLVLCSDVIRLQEVFPQVLRRARGLGELLWKGLWKGLWKDLWKGLWKWPLVAPHAACGHPFETIRHSPCCG